MPDARAAKPEAPPPPVLRLDEDYRFARVPTVRQAMILHVPVSGGSSRVSITETKSGGKLGIEVGGIEREVAMNVRELRELAQFCYRIARLAAIRPEWKP